MGAFGILMTIISNGVKHDSQMVAKEICAHDMQIKINTKRIEVLERQNDVILNELTHINRKLDELIIIKKEVHSG
jgi:hypothetical protein